MNHEQWFAASLVFAVLNEQHGLWRRVTSVVLVRASNFDEGFALACDLGFEREETYSNSEGEQVRWAFERVATLDILPESLAHGMELFSDPGEELDDPSVPFDVAFDPRSAGPGQSGVSPT